MKRRGALVGVVVALAITVAACGSGSGTDAVVSIKTLQLAADNTQAASSMSFDLNAKISAAGHDLEMTGHGVASTDAKYGQVTLEMGMLGSIEERVTPDGFYLNIGTLGADELPDGKHWVFMSYDAMKEQLGTDIRELIDQSKQNSPQQGLEYLRAAGDVTEVGPDTVGGASATHYTVQIDYAKYAAEHLDSASPELREKIAKLGELPADVWIDGQDRIVKMRYVIDAGAFGAKSGRVEMTMEITGFDVPVDVQPPPADDTVDFSAFSSVGT